MSIDIERVRADIPSVQRNIYMNTGWAGPRPVSVTQAIKERYDYESSEGPGHAVAVITGQETQLKAKGALAKLIGVTPDEITFTQNTTEALNLIMNGLPLQNGDEVVLCDLEHTAVIIPALYLQKRRGCTVKVIKIDPANDDKATILSKFNDAVTGKTRLVVASHIQYSTGLRMPIKELAAMAHQRGAYMLVDGAQAVGHMNVNIPELGADFYAFPAHKWLLGPEGLGILYMRKDLISKVEPLILSEDSVTGYGLDGNFIPNTGNISRYTASTQAPAMWAGVIAAVEYVNSWGLPSIEAHIMDMSSLLKRALPKIAGLTLLSHIDGDLASGIVSFSIKGAEPAEVATSLWNSGHCVARWINYPACTRLCISFFNSDRDVNGVFGLIRKAADGASADQDLEKIKKSFF
jgi:selenocysteine lyase/cysteine desulfurase